MGNSLEAQLWGQQADDWRQFLSQFVNVGVVATQFAQLFNEMLKNALGAVFSTYLS